MKLWPTDPDPGPGNDRTVTAVILILTILGVIVAFLVWGHR